MKFIRIYWLESKIKYQLPALDLESGFTLAEVIGISCYTVYCCKDSCFKVGVSLIKSLISWGDSELLEELSSKTHIQNCVVPQSVSSDRSFCYAQILSILSICITGCLAYSAFGSYEKANCVN